VEWAVGQTIGETLLSIAMDRLGPDAKRSDVRFYARELVRVNGITNPRRIRDGTFLILPEAQETQVTLGEKLSWGTDADPLPSNALVVC
jgi:hypothetical protein